MIKEATPSHKRGRYVLSMCSQNLTVEESVIKYLL